MTRLMRGASRDVARDVSLDVAESGLWEKAWWLAIATILYNLIEGAVSVWYGLSDEALALFGFGADSFIEIFSAIAIAHMIWRLRRHGSEQRDAFERTALRLTGGGLVGLSVVLAATSILAVIAQHSPESTVAGIIVSSISIVIMWWLIRAKVRIGTQLGSAPIIADAACSRACLHMSVVLLVSSTANHLLGIAFIDAIGAAVLALYAYREGMEQFAKARGITCSDGCH
jgi:hypothetical protein